jgi:hypothetical protein
MCATILRWVALPATASSALPAPAARCGTTDKTLRLYERERRGRTTERADARLTHGDSAQRFGEGSYREAMGCRSQQEIR